MGMGVGLRSGGTSLGEWCGGCRGAAVELASLRRVAGCWHDLGGYCCGVVDRMLVGADVRPEPAGVMVAEKTAKKR